MALFLDYWQGVRTINIMENKVEFYPRADTAQDFDVYFFGNPWGTIEEMVDGTFAFYLDKQDCLFDWQLDAISKKLKELNS